MKSTTSRAQLHAGAQGQMGVDQNNVVIIQKGNFFSELERLKCLDNHRQRLD